MNIAYVGPYDFLNGSAIATRVTGIASALVGAGHQVVLASGGRDDGQRSITLNGKSQRVCHTAEIGRSGRSMVGRAFQVLALGVKTTTWLAAQQAKPDVVVVYGTQFGYLHRLNKWGAKFQIPIIVDMTEWYDPSHLPGGRFGMHAIAYGLSNRWVVPKANHVIAISRYLQKYYQKRGCHTICIPPVYDTTEFPIPTDTLRSNLPLTIAYVGNPGKKDLLETAINAVLRVDPEGKRLRFIIAGPSEDELLKMSPLRSNGQHALPRSIVAYGRVPHNRAIQIVSEADFTILLRPEKRYAAAGFPTKVVESLVMGTPVICNMTSDLSAYIRDGIEGLICKDFSVGACVAALERAMAMRSDELRAMRGHARERAEKKFDYRCFEGALNDFLMQVQGQVYMPGALNMA